MQLIKQSILCVDDDEDSLELLTIIFEQEGFDVKSCNSLEDCLPLIYENDFTAIILDNWFSGGTSLEVCRKIRSFNSTIPIIYYSAEVRETEIKKALATGATAYLMKPDDFDEITETVSQLIQAKQAKVLQRPF
jgi:DNA-binding response OmpR family regulator